jgi:hypothetical protein
MHGVKHTTVHHVQTVEHQRMSELPFEEARLCRCSLLLCASREILVKRQLLLLPIVCMPRNGVLSPASQAMLRRSARSIPMFHADFPPFASKIVEHSRYLPKKRFCFVGKGTVSLQFFLMTSNKKYLLLVSEPQVMLS